MDFGLLAPALVGAVVAMVGFFALLWMNHNRPRLELPASEVTAQTFEEVDATADAPLSGEISPEESLLRHIFGEPLTPGPKHRQGDVVVRRYPTKAAVEEAVRLTRAAAQQAEQPTLGNVNISVERAPAPSASDRKPSPSQTR